MIMILKRATSPSFYSNYSIVLTTAKKSIYRLSIYSISFLKSIREISLPGSCDEGCRPQLDGVVVAPHEVEASVALNFAVMEVPTLTPSRYIINVVQ